MALPWRLDGRRVLITGASRGIGAAIAEALAGAGASVAVNAATPESEECAALAAKLNGFALPLDLGPPGSGKLLVRQAEAALGGPIDVLVLCAAIQIEREWDEALPEDMDLQWSINLRESLVLAQTIVPGMCERGWGRVVGISSVQNARPHPRMMAYAALKAGLTNALRNLAIVVAGKGVTVNVISPGAMDTPRNEPLLKDPAALDRMLQRIPMGRLGRADECGGAALFLCSDAAGYVTGADIPVDGGLALGGL
ncbi:3-oxoacyl-reductase [Hyaloraphidium curvatum]|nr:3-oxoacyl-reductase [Hyaloraphidium curvatum]